MESKRYSVSQAVAAASCIDEKEVAGITSANELLPPPEDFKDEEKRCVSSSRFQEQLACSSLPTHTSQLVKDLTVTKEENEGLRSEVQDLVEENFSLFSRIEEREARFQIELKLRNEMEEKWYAEKEELLQEQRQTSKALHGLVAEVSEIKRKLTSCIQQIDYIENALANLQYKKESGGKTDSSEDSDDA